MQIIDGTGKGNRARVTGQRQLAVHAESEDAIAYVSREQARAYSIYTTDAGAEAGEYTLYVQNDSEIPFVIDKVITSCVSADVVWILHHVTGTATGASVVTPKNLNLGSGKTADLTCRGGAAGVDDLTSSAVLASWGNGVAYFPMQMMISGITLERGSAIALEYDAGSTARAEVTIMGHFHEE